VVIFADLGTFLADAHAKQGHVAAVHRTCFQGMKGTHTDIGTFIHYFNDLLRKKFFKGLQIGQKVFAIDPGVKTGVGVKGLYGEHLLLRIKRFGKLGNDSLSDRGRMFRKIDRK